MAWPFTSNQLKQGTLHIMADVTEEFYHLLYKLLSNDQNFFGMEKIKEISLEINRSQNDLKEEI